MSYAVTLPGTIGGFTFKGVHSSVYGVRQTPKSQVLTPQKRRTLLVIPGRSSAIIQEDGGYDVRTETVECSYAAQEGVNLYRQVRRIAGWLDGIGELVFDYEPEMRYMAFLSSPPPTIKMLSHAIFDLEFTFNSPFAYEVAEAVNANINNSGDSFVIATDGTIKTPVILTLTNIGTTVITNIVITASHIEA
jgi:phage-related protein